MSYSFGIRENRCEGWFQALARPLDGGADRTSKRFPDAAQAMQAINYFVKNGQFKIEEEAIIDENVTEESCESEVISRMEKILDGTMSFTGRRCADGRPYVRQLRRHVGMKDITTTERNDAYKIIMGDE